MNRKTLLPLIMVFFIYSRLLSQYFINPFIQHNDTTLIYYGSGDLDSNSVINWEDYNLMISNVQNDMSDIDSDGIKSSVNDCQILNDYLSGNLAYLPCQWNKLWIHGTKEERIDWINKILEIDKTDTLPYIPYEWECGNYATQICINFTGLYGIYNLSSKGENWWNEYGYKYDLSNVGRFNIPVMDVSCFVDWGGNINGHFINAVLIGNDYKNFDDWYFFEPQSDYPYESSDLASKPGWSCDVNIKYKIHDSDGFHGDITIVGWKFDLSHNALCADSLEKRSVEYPRIFVNRAPHFDFISPIINIKYPINSNSYNYVDSISFSICDEFPNELLLSFDGGQNWTSYKKNWIDKLWDFDNLINEVYPLLTIQNLQSFQGKNTWIIKSNDLNGNTTIDSVNFFINTNSTILEPITCIDDFDLEQNYPNPFNPITNISYALSKYVHVTLTVYNMNGQIIKTLIDQNQYPGHYTVKWDASNYPSGVYIYQIYAGNFHEIRKCMLLK